MTKIWQFEKLNVWIAARALVNLVYEETTGGAFSKDFALKDQIRRAAISVMSNIAEGFDSGYDREFIRFLGFSFRSLSEVQSQLYTALDQGYIDHSRFVVLYDKSVEAKKMIRSLVKYLSENQITGRVAREDPSVYGAERSVLFDIPAEFVADQSTN